MQKQFSPITIQQFADFKKQAASAGIDVPEGNKGEAKTHGIDLGFDYDGENILTLTIISKPWYIPASTIWEQLAPYLPK